MLTLTSPVETPLHRRPAGAKLAILAAFTFGLFLITSPLILGGALGLVVLAYLSSGRVFARHGFAMLRPIWPFVVVVAVWHLWTNAGWAGLAIILRMVAAVAAANLVTMTTRLSDMIQVLEMLARPFQRLVPPQRLALSIALVIRFVPVMSDRFALIAEAFRARSGRRAGWRIIAPAALAALDDAERVADALRARGGTE